MSTQLIRLHEPDHTGVQHTKPMGRDLAPPENSQLLHGVVLRPPSSAGEAQPNLAAQLQSLDSSSAAQVPGVIACVHRGNFVGVVAAQLNQAIQARALLDARWLMPIEGDTPGIQDGDLVKPGSSLARTRYEWQSDTVHTAHAWATAWHQDNSLTLWVNTRRVSSLKRELVALTGLSDDDVFVVSHGRDGPDGFDTAVDAAVLAWGLHKPVRVQAEHTVGPLTLELHEGASQESGLAAQTRNSQWTINAVNPNRPSIAATLCGLENPLPGGLQLRTGYFSAPSQQTSPGMASADTYGYTAATVFAQESQFDELCDALALDPIEARLNEIKDSRGQALLKRVAEQAGWNSDADGASARSTGAIRQGRGIAYSHVIDHDQQPPQEVWSAWAVELNVDTLSGELSVSKLTVGHDSSHVAPDVPAAPSGEALEHHLGRWTQSLLGQAGSDKTGETIYGDEHALSLPEVRLVNTSRAVDKPLAWSLGAELPAAAAIANAIHNATGLRLRETPFTLPTLSLETENGGKRGAKWRKSWLGGLAAAATGALLVASPWRAPISPVNQVDTSIFSAGAIERGRLVALAGDCMVCHTTEGGQPNAGGLGLDTPFGTIYTTNITPDKETGIGTWSYKAFERAMREGIHQDGRHLYPAFPYTAYAKISDEDLQSLYAHLMTQEPVYAPNKETRLPFPMNMRPLVAGWNLLYHRDRQAYTPDADKSTLWNRGAYLVNSSGHCAACHSPRNALGAEKSGANKFLAGGFADNWEAPALTALSTAPIPWTENELFQYLRTGYSPLHGVAAGPMGPVVAGLAQLPENDVRAMAHYLSSLNPVSAEQEQEHAVQAASLEAASRAEGALMLMPGESLFNGACAVCHDAREGPVLFGSRPSLGLNSNLHSDHPDNTIQVLMHGITRPALAALGAMPGFKNSMNDKQMEELLVYMRKRFAPDKPAWTGLKSKIATIRQQAGHL